MNITRAALSVGSSLAVAGAVTFGLAQPAHATGWIVQHFNDKQTCMDAGLDKYGDPEPVLNTNAWGCGISLNKEGGWDLWVDDNFGD